jgi:3-isopropylmalate/(R)-2-methylmalate dehydratase small subunit
MTGGGGRIWRFGDDIDTDALAPGLYMKLSIAELARHCLESVVPEFAAAVRPGDIVVAGRNFGMGSSREQAVLALRQLGVQAVLARSFAGIFYRNALNLGLLALVCPNGEALRAGDRGTVDGTRGEASNLTTAVRIPCEPLPPHLVQMVADGGLVPHLERRLARRREKT